MAKLSASQVYFCLELDVFSISGPLVTFRHNRLNHDVLNNKSGFGEIKI